jgi:hypothetical protein
VKSPAGIKYAEYIYSFQGINTLKAGWRVFSETALMMRGESRKVEVRTEYTQRRSTKELPAESQT